jgi:flagella basal body P-ring formation protein FlgA
VIALFTPQLKQFVAGRVAARALRGLTAIALLVVLHTPTGHAAEVTVTLRPITRISGTAVTIGHVAEVTSTNYVLEKKVADLELTHLPPDATRTPTAIQKIQVQALIAFAGLDGVQPVIYGPETILVSVVSAEEMTEQCRLVIHRQLAEALETEARYVQVEMAELIRPEQMLPASMSTEVQWKVRLPSPTKLGRLRIPVEVWDDGQRKKSFGVTVDAKWYTSVVVAQAPIDVNQELTEDVIAVERRWIDDLADRNSLGAIANTTSKRILDPGSIIRKAEVSAVRAKPTNVVAARKTVTITLRRGPLTIRTSGEALQAGQKGELVQVRNLTSKAVIVARVVSESEVEVPF